MGTVSQELSINLIKGLQEVLLKEECSSILERLVNEDGVYFSREEIEGRRSFYMPSLTDNEKGLSQLQDVVKEIQERGYEFYIGDTLVADSKRIVDILVSQDEYSGRISYKGKGKPFKDLEGNVIDRDLEFNEESFTVQVNSEDFDTFYSFTYNDEIILYEKDSKGIRSLFSTIGFLVEDVYLSQILLFDTEVAEHLYNAIQCYDNYTEESGIRITSNFNISYLGLLECCPSILNKYNWSKPVKVPEALVGCSDNLIYDSDLDSTVLMVHMKGENPTVSECFGNDIFKLIPQEDIDVFVNTLNSSLNTPIKKAYIVIDNDGMLGKEKMIMRECDDGEIVVTIY